MGMMGRGGGGGRGGNRDFRLYLRRRVDWLHLNALLFSQVILGSIMGPRDFALLLIRLMRRGSAQTPRATRWTDRRCPPCPGLIEERLPKQLFKLHEGLFCWVVESGQSRLALDMVDQGFDQYAQVAFSQRLNWNSV